jgi:hypothetical protein
VFTRKHGFVIGQALASEIAECSMLAVERSLHPAGFKAIAVRPLLAPKLSSRSASLRRLAPDPRLDLEGFIERLVAILRQRPHDVLLPGSDFSLLAVSSFRDTLAPDGGLGLPASSTVAGALSRARLAITAARVGLTSPESRLCSEAADAVAAGGKVGYRYS